MNVTSQKVSSIMNTTHRIEDPVKIQFFLYKMKRNKTYRIVDKQTIKPNSTKGQSHLPP